MRGDRNEGPPGCFKVACFIAAVTVAGMFVLACLTHPQ